MPSLAFIDFAFGIFIECAEIQMMLITIQDIGINSGFFLDVTVHHQFLDSVFKSFSINDFFTIFIVQFTPRDALHFLSICLECSIYPLDDVSKIKPQLICVRVMLVLAHIRFNVSMRYPTDGSFKEILTDGRAIEISASYAICRTTAFPDFDS